MSVAPKGKSLPLHLHLLGAAGYSTRCLLVLSQQGDALAFERLYQVTEPILTRFLQSRHLPAAVREEVVQEVFCRIWCGRRHITVQSASAETYLMAVALNIVREINRRTRRHRDFDAAASDRCVAVEELPHVRLQQAELAQQLRHARNQLSYHEEAAVELVYDAMQSPRQAATSLGCTINALQCRLRRARVKLKKTMELFDHDGHR
jgi:RNA polymerase sigma-70 factor (ECF subfamily)